MGIRIAGTGSYLPEKVLTNSDLEKIVETTDEWICTRTGIKERRIAEANVPTSDLAAKAAEAALAMAGIGAEQLNAMSVASITQDKIFPSTACIVQRKIKASNAFCFDLQAACSGLLYSLEVAKSILLTHPEYKYFMVIGAEKLSSIVDWQDRSTCVLFGDGAAAILLEKTEDDENCFIGSKLGSDGNYADILQIQAGGSDTPASHETVDKKMHFMKMDGQAVFKLAVNAMVGACRETMEKCGVHPSQIKWLVPHQANYRILKTVAAKLDISEENVYMNVHKFGNTSAASIGLCIDEIVRGGKIQKGEYMLLTAFGGGLTWGATLVKW
ncbi:MAG: 3-oxoacyl-ACP synthase [Lentisphaerae bacterium GWF2_45_14]|nr:MAG: 3-oxoacyl-ACP synthase [Lentisphaerae bacterium GWF2_45_14]